MATLTVLILNWNGLEDTVECVDAVLASTFDDFTARVIDNGSHGRDADALEARYAGHSKIRVERNAVNLGFTGGMNKALRQLLDADPSDYVLLLNNDAVVAPDCLEAMVATAKQNGAGIVGSRMLRYDAPEILDNAGHLWLNTGEIVPRGAGEAADAYGEPAALVGVCAGAALYRMDLFRELGVFDDYFDTGYEDAEFGLRAFLAAYPSHYCPTAVVRHKVSRSIDKIRDLDYAINIQRNINYTVIKLTPLSVLLINLPFMALKTLAVPLTALLFLRFRLFRAHLAALARTSRDLPRALAARRRTARARVTVRDVLRAQRFFGGVYLSYFRDYLLTGRKTVFER